MDLRSIACDHEGTALAGQIALPEGPGPHPAVLVMPNAFGLGEQVKRQARLLAQRGYVAVATDMYGGGLLCAGPKDSGPQLKALHDDPRKLRARVIAWYDILRARPEVDAARIAAIGYCFGGQCVLELARSGADVKAVVSFHGLLSTAMPAQQGAVKAQVVVYSGAKDPYAPRAHVDALQEEMTAAGARWHVTVFGDVYHSFTDPDAGSLPIPGLKYDPLADHLSWTGTLALLEATLRA